MYHEKMRIIGDKIYYDGVHVATINEKAIHTYLENFKKHIMKRKINE